FLCEHTARNSGLTAVPNSRPFSDTPTCILRFIGYMIEKDLGETDIYCEASLLPVNNVTNMILKVTIKV
ncbi:hypothetical protein ACFFJN_04240, partial [Erwinia mallotivora]|uniref:hypothetical protein n=1 Tax=Erwinia mallotivora TaxID=69222 RepID=UPI0035E9199F